MFTIIGSDGKEYGPISGDQLRQWIREGRAGGSTRVRRPGDDNWVSLNSMSEFADVFQAPPLSPGTMPGALPPVVRTFGVLCLVFGVIGVLQRTASWFGLIMAIRHAPTFSPFSGMFFFYQFVGLAGVLIHFIGGAGLLRGREWARKLTVYYAVFATLFGLYGLGRSVYWFTASESAIHALSSVSFMFNLGVSVVMLVFHIAAIVLLSRKSVRQALH